MVGQAHAAHRAVLVVVLFIFIRTRLNGHCLEVRDAWVTHEVLVVTAVAYFTLRSVYDKRNKPRR